jgi:hypothetical protein
MAGELNGLQTKIKAIASRALFTHCFAHRLNLILQDTCSKIMECGIFDIYIIYIYFLFYKVNQRIFLIARLESNFFSQR